MFLTRSCVSRSNIEYGLFCARDSALEGSATCLSAFFKFLPGLIPFSSVWRAG